MIFHKPVSTIPGAYQQIRQLGTVTGHGPQATCARRADEGADRRDRRQAEAVGPGASVYHELDPSFFSATSKTFVGRVYALFGLKNIADAAPGGSDYPQLSPEYIVSSNPDLVVLADSVCCGQTAETVARDRAGRASRPCADRSILRDRRLDRVALGAAARELRARGRVRARRLES